MSGRPTAIHSWEELQESIAYIVARLNEDRDLAVAAAVSPFLALEELGFRVIPEARPEIEDRLRFAPREAAQRGKLRKRIFKLAGGEFDIRSAEALHKVLFEDLSLQPYPDKRGCVPAPPDTHPPRRQRPGAVPMRDPLDILEGRHPIIDPLLEYRRLDASRPCLAPASVYQTIRRGEVSHGIQGLRIRLKGAQPARG